MQPARNPVTAGTTALVVALAGCGGTGPDVRSEPEASSTTVRAAPAAPVDLDGVTGPLEPGTYALRVRGGASQDDLPRAVLEVPEGWHSDGGSSIGSGSPVDEPGRTGQISVWHVERVYRDPCRPRSTYDQPENASFVSLGLLRQEGPHHTRARRVVLNGYLGTRMRVKVPPRTDLAQCVDGQLSLWRTADGTVHGLDQAGVLHHLWVLDVGDTPLVVVATAHPDQPDEQTADVLAVAETITFAEP